LPCVGVALIIFSNRDIPTLSGKILSIRPLVFVGLISYSLYLWHWPILVFVKYRFFDYKLEKYGLPMLLGTFVLSFFTWKFVESPFRKQAILKSRKQIFTYAGIFTAVLFISGLTIHWMIGLPPDTLLSRRQLTEESAQNEKEETSNINTATQNMESAARYAEGENDRGFRIELTLKQALAGEFIELGDGDKHAPIELFVSGDSHAMSVLSIIDVLCKEYHVRGVAATHSSTIPLVDYDSHGDNSLYDDSIPFQKAILDFIRNQHVRDVLFVSYWSAYASQGQTLRIREGVFRTINAYSESGVRLWFMKPVPKPPWNVPRFLYSAALQGQNPEEIGLPLTEHRKIEPLLDQIFGGVDAPRVTILDPTMCFVNSNQLCRVARGGRSLYWDDNHLSSAGALELRPLFKQIFRAIVIGK
ncbi:MAG: acyltransferase, partial [Verrucomicrobia bacterium]|nr:acyltransferase [Verrucomicrobiota bacterium]